VIGVVSHLYTNSIQRQLFTNNNETARIVQVTADIERGLYQSLVYLNSIKESEEPSGTQTTIDEPTVSMLTPQFFSEIATIKAQLDTVLAYIEQANILDQDEDIQEARLLNERIQFYESLSREWLILVNEDRNQADALFYTSINPYFRNRIIPVITLLRERTIDKQDIENQILTDQLSTANYGIAILTFISILTSILIAFYVYRSIANPLVRLNNTASKFGAGDLDARVDVKNKDEIGQLASTFNEMASNLKKRTLARDYLDNIIESIQETLIVTDEQEIVVGVNNAGAKMLHYSKEEIIGKSVEEFFDLKNMKKQYEKKSGKGDIFEFALLTKRKNRIPVLFSEAELINAGGDKVGAVYVATDISERKKADQKMRESLKEKEILLSEIHHRVKNNLAVISGILQLQVYHTDNKKVNKALKESQSRIQSMSLVHEMLYQSESMAFINYKKYVNDLLQAISSMHLNEDRDIDIISEVEEVKFDLNQAIPCSLLLNEIIVNSYKHAFDDQSKGFIRVKMREEEGKVHLIVEDNGVGVTQETINTSESLGSTLIRTLTSQLKGTYEIGTLEDGTGTSIKVVFEKEPISEFKLK
jgi:PAS domain S-box-containing protein